MRPCVATMLLLACFAAAAAEPEKTAAKPLDLKLPDITRIFTQEQINRILAGIRDPDTIEEVEVEGLRRRAPVPNTPVISSPLVSAGIFSPFWALAHPTQAWRILAPIPPDQAQFIGNTPPDASDPYRAPTLPTF
ncbi:MAG TPA: hypothetical protein PKE27_07100 [Povalibacter sp.]|uniref:hypothetical protein n=1 Tax=Povalibacter sp. TaxID=1962978 RepID=UPI002CCDB331|nr:hypothetical protein [Povalibacter sp.]HMN44320.1 hypothetical protein [Povalibacter sp.]